MWIHIRTVIQADIHLLDARATDRQKCKRERITREREQATSREEGGGGPWTWTCTEMQKARGGNEQGFTHSHHRVGCLVDRIRLDEPRLGAIPPRLPLHPVPVRLLLPVRRVHRNRNVTVLDDTHPCFICLCVFMFMFPLLRVFIASAQHNVPSYPHPQGRCHRHRYRRGVHHHGTHLAIRRVQAYRCI